MTYHSNLKKSSFSKMTLISKLANVGSEVYRAILWKEKNRKYSQMAIERALELLNFTINNEKNFFRLKELTRIRECLLDYFFGKNEYQSTDKQWQDYFYSFNYLSQVNK